MQSWVVSWVWWIHIQLFVSVNRETWEAYIVGSLDGHHIYAKGSKKADLEQWLSRKTFLSLVDLYENCCTWPGPCPISKLFSPVILWCIGVKSSVIRFSSSDNYLPVQSILSKKQPRCPSDSGVWFSVHWLLSKERVILSVARKFHAFFSLIEEFEGVE